MSADAPGALGRPDVPDRPEAPGDVQSMPLHAERLAVTKRVRKTHVRVARTTRTRETLVEADLAHDQVVIERIAVGRVVDATPEIRREGDVTVLPVVVEELVVTRRLILKEEVHVRQVRTTERHVETAVLREQEAAVTRTEVEG